MKKYYIIILSVLILSCEDIITPDLPSNDPILVVDAWINNLEKDQVIKLSESQNYLDSSTPIPVWELVCLSMMKIKINLILLKLMMENIFGRQILSLKILVKLEQSFISV